LKTYDFVIIGAGITGLSLARQLIRKDSQSSILVLEKEPRFGLHGSGRNSGVLHSGVYYEENSLKARVCGAGAKELACYCDENNLPIARMGKVIVPVREGDDAQIDILHQRATHNGANVAIVDSQQLREIEPEVVSLSGRALHSPDTAVIDPLAVLTQLVHDLLKKGVEIQFDCAVTVADLESSTIIDNRGNRVGYGHLFNAAGQCSDHIARLFGVGNKYMLLPIKGIYFSLDKKSGIQLNGLVYPVPDLAVPFLGVHSVKTIQGSIYLGPTAIPAFGSENYKGMTGIKIDDAIRITFQLIQLYLRNNQGFRKFTNEEAGRFLKRRFVKAAGLLIPKLKVEHLQPSEKVGIRAQLLNKESHELVMDFLVEQKGNTSHILNAVSPAFTSSFAFARHVVQKLTEG